MTKYQVFGFCNPMVERSVEVDEAFLEVAGLKKAGSNLLRLEDYVRVEGLIRKREVEITEDYAGGSGSNIIAGLASLGIESCFFGGIGKDENGDFLEREMQEEYGVHPLLIRKDAPTCTIYTLITPDKERTFAVYLGAAQELEPRDIPLEALVNSEYLVVTGYKVMDVPQTTQALLEEARKNNVKIVLDLSCGLHISNAKGFFERVMQEGVHILLANEEETQTLYGVKKGSSEKVYFDVVSKKYLGFPNIDMVIQKLGERGALVATKHARLISPAFEVDVINLNGAGDGFATGFIYGLIKYDNLITAVRLANYCASKVIAQVGPRMGFSKEELERVA